MKTFITWEIWRDAEKLKGKTFKATVNGFGINKDDKALLMGFANIIGLGMKTQYGYDRMLCLTGFEEWELVQEPATFMEAFNHMKDGGLSSSEGFSYYFSGANTLYCGNSKNGKRSGCAIYFQKHMLTDKWFIEDGEIDE